MSILCGNHGRLPQGLVTEDSVMHMLLKRSGWRENGRVDCEGTICVKMVAPRDWKI